MKMNKTKPTKIFSELFDVILTGNKDDSRVAARGVRKLLYSSRNSGKYNELKAIIENASEKYRKITEDWRRENFVMAVSVLYYLHNEENSPDFLFPWLFHLLQHKNGNIRNVARRMIENELGPLTVHIRVSDWEQSKSKTEQSDIILLSLFIDLNNLLAGLLESKYKKYKYISSLPTSPYKTVQMVLSEMEDSCGKEYMKRLKSRLSKC